MALRTITPNHLHPQQISLYAPRLRSRHTEDPAYDWYGQWLELDHLIVQLWESHSIRPKVSYWASPGEEEEGARSRVSSLLLEAANRRIGDFVERG